MKAIDLKILCFLAVMLFVQSTAGQEIVYPSGYDINVTYAFDNTEYSTIDTILITRTVENNMSTVLENLYLIDILPHDFELIEFELTVDDIEVAFYYNIDENNLPYPDYNLYEWVIDYPGQDDTANVNLAPSQTLQLSASFICNTDGVYQLPFHGICCNNDETGYFTTAAIDSIEIIPYTSIDELALPDKSDLGVAYPNPFNGEVLIGLAGNRLVSGDAINVNVYDISGRLVFGGKLNSSNKLRWRPGAEIAGGIYFYSIKAESIITTGKLVYLK